jgi:hypothetical protein
MADRMLVDFALGQLAALQQPYQRYRAYYGGEHDLAFATDAFEQAFGQLLKAFAYNRCASVIDSTADRLQVTGWESREERDEIGALANAIWTRNRGDWLQSVLHVEALTKGDAYAVVWPDAEGKARIRPNRADLVTVLYDDDDPERVVLAVKCWPIVVGELARHWRVTVYEADRITRWITPGPKDERPKTLEQLTPYQDEAPHEVTHRYGMVPVIPFPNNQLMPGHHGISELRDVMPLQDGLNKAVADSIIAGEFLAFPQRWVTGFAAQLGPDGKPVQPFDPGLDKLWGTSSTEARFGEFSAADLRQYSLICEDWDTRISRVSRVPVHWLGQAQGVLPSGESLKTAEAPFVAKIKDRQMRKGASWRQVMTLSLLIEGVPLERATTVAPEWQPPEARSDQEFWQNAQLKRAVGVPREQIWREAGYSEEQIAQFAALNAAAAEREAERAAVAFNAGREF